MHQLSTESNTVESRLEDLMITVKDVVSFIFTWDRLNGQMFARPRAYG